MAGYLFLAPALTVYAVGTVVPFIQVFRLSLFRASYITAEWVGLANYAKLLGDSRFWQSVWNSTCFLFFMVPAMTLIPLVAALAVLSLGRRWQTYARTVFYLPAFVSGVILTTVWRWIYHPKTGIANWILSCVGLGPVHWLGGRWSAIMSISIIAVLAGMGTTLIVYLAVMMGIPREVYEAARIDGATSGQIKRRIVIPYISPTIALIALLSIIGTLQLWSLPYLLTAGGPGWGTMTVMFYIVRVGWMLGRHGYANAVAVVLLILLLLLSYPVYRIRYRRMLR